MNSDFLNERAIFEILFNKSLKFPSQNLLLDYPEVWGDNSTQTIANA